MEVFAQICGSNMLLSPPSVSICSSHHRLLFQAPENFQRLCYDKRIKINKISHIFLCERDHSSIGGLFGLLLSSSQYAAKSQGNITIPVIFGPSGTKELLDVFRREVDPISHLKPVCQNLTQTTFAKLLETETEVVFGIVLEDEEPSKKKLFIRTTSHTKPTIFYLVLTKKSKGTLNIKKALELGVPKDNSLSKLKNGESIILSSGVVVKPEDVISGIVPGTALLIGKMNSLSSKFLPKALSLFFDEKDTKTLFSQVAGLSQPMLHAVFDVSSGEGVQEALKMTRKNVFKGVDFFHLDGHDWNPSGEEGRGEERRGEERRGEEKISEEREEVLAGARSINKELHKSFGGPFFPLWQSFPKRNDTHSLYLPNMWEEINLLPYTRPSFFSSINLALPTGFQTQEGEARGGENKGKDREEGEERQQGREGDVEERTGKNERGEERRGEEKREEETSKRRIVFLGTGASLPSKYRGVSGTLIHINEETIIGIDLGEGSLTAMTHIYGEDIEKTLFSLEAVLLSHVHCDHHLGVIQVIAMRKKLFPLSSPMVVVAPHHMRVWLCSALGGEDAFVFCACEDLVLTAPSEALCALANGERSFEMSERTLQAVAGSPHVVTRRHCCDRTNLEKTGAAIGLVSFSERRGEERRGEKKGGEETVKGERELLEMGVRVRTGLVPHVRASFAFRLEFLDQGVICVSGDCFPSYALADLAKDADVLIHEATFATNQLVESISTMHSTIGGAVGLATRANVKQLILSHFSQRFSTFEPKDIIWQWNEGESLSSYSIMDHDNVIQTVEGVDSSDMYSRTLFAVDGISIYLDTKGKILYVPKENTLESFSKNIIKKLFELHEERHEKPI